MVRLLQQVRLKKTSVTWELSQAPTKKLGLDNEKTVTKLLHPAASGFHQPAIQDIIRRSKRTNVTAAANVSVVDDLSGTDSSSRYPQPEAEDEYCFKRG